MYTNKHIYIYIYIYIVSIHRTCAFNSSPYVCIVSAFVLDQYIHRHRYLNIQIQSLFHGTWQKRPRELDPRLRFETEEMTLQMQ